MITILSIICCYGFSLFVFILSLCKNVFFLLALLYGVVGFFSMLAFFSIIVLFILLVPVQIMGKNPKPFSKFRWNLTRDIAMYSLYWLNIRVKVEGLEKLDKNKHYIFYCNHQNFMDFFVLYYGLKDFPHSEVYKSEILKMPLVRGTAKSLGGVSLDRFDDRSALISVNETIKRINEGQTFLIFPEGTRTKDANLNQYKPGSFKIATKVDCDLCILVIDNGYKITRNKMWHRTVVDLRVVDIIEKENLPLETMELSELVYNKSKENIELNRSKKKYLNVPNWYKKGINKRLEKERLYNESKKK